MHSPNTLWLVGLPRRRSSLSNAGQCGQQLLVILNDNGMSIAKNVGGVADHLARQRIKPQYLRFKRRYRKAMQG